MSVEVGSKLPDATLMQIGEAGPEKVRLADRLKGKRVAMFAVPGAFTPTCDSAHLPSFVKNAEAFKAKGVDEIICVSVNDPFVMHAWGETSGANAAGIAMLSDPQGDFAKSIEMAFDAEGAGLYDRSKRYAAFVEDGVVKIWSPETSRGCEISGGDAMLKQI